MVVEHHARTGPTKNAIAHPAKSYALICGNCHMHNGKQKLILSFHVPSIWIEFIVWLNDANSFDLRIFRSGKERRVSIFTYYCPHCHALNQPKRSGLTTKSTSPTGAFSVEEADIVPNAGGSIGDTVSIVGAADATSGSWTCASWTSESSRSSRWPHMWIHVKAVKESFNPKKRGYLFLLYS